MQLMMQPRRRCLCKAPWAACGQQGHPLCPCVHCVLASQHSHACHGDIRFKLMHLAIIKNEERKPNLKKRTTKP